MGVTNLVFTILAIMLIDRFGRRLLMIFGLSGIAISMCVLALGFGSATYTLDRNAVESLPEHVDRAKASRLEGITFNSDIAFKAAVEDAFGATGAKEVTPDLITKAIKMNSLMILLGIIGFVASFAVSLGPVMWVLFSELFPNYIRGLAISFAGFINSGVSFLVQLVFPWELSVLGSSNTFLIYGIFAALGLVFVTMFLPETKNKSLEELEMLLVNKRKPASANE